MTPGSSSPYSTGGGGVRLEHRYAATLLAALLTGDPLSELGDRIVPRLVRLQASDVSPIDDIVVEGRAPDGQMHRVSIGVRRDPALTARDASSIPLMRSFLRIVDEHWSDVAQGRWRLGLAVAVSGPGVRETAELARVAQSMRSSADFRATVVRVGATSREVRARLAHLDGLVTAANDTRPTLADAEADDLTWRWLFAVRVRQLRLEGVDESDRTAAIRALRSVAADGSVDAADSLFSALAELSGGWASAGARVDEALARRALSGFALRPTRVANQSLHHHQECDRLGAEPIDDSTSSDQMGVKASRRRLRLRRAIDLSPIDLGVNRAAQPTEAAMTRLKSEKQPVELPPYVRRDIDEELERALSVGGLVILEGPSASGKTRTAFEAIRRSPTAWNVFIPADTAHLRAEMEPLTHIRDLVVWLDDIERYLVSGDFDDHLLSVLCGPRDGAAVLLATLRAEERRTLERRASETSDANSGRKFASISRVLKRATIIRVPRHLSDQERSYADTMRWDARISEALDQASGADMTEYICAGPAAMRRWIAGTDGAHPVGAAIVSAAVDCRRAGYWKPVPSKVLKDLHRLYLDRRLARRDDLASFEEGIRWAAEPVHGACSCIEPMGERTYSAFDYLVDYAQQQFEQTVPDTVFRTIMDFADPDMAYSVASAANEQDLLDIAFEGYCRAAAAGNVDAMFMAGTDAIIRLDRVDEGLGWLRTAADLGYQPAMGTLGSQLYMMGQRAEGKAWMERSAREGDLHAAGILGITLHRVEERPDLAEGWLRQAIPLKQPEVITALAEVLTNLGRPSAAEPLFHRAINANHAPAMYAYASVLFERQQWQEAEALWKRAAEQGDLMSQAWYGALLALKGDDEAETWLRAAAQQGDEVGKHFLRLWLKKWRRKKAGSVPNAVERLPDFYLTFGDAMNHAGNLDRAAEYWTNAEGLGSTTASARLRALRPDKSES